MSQSTFIGGVLVIAFLFFLAARGRLHVYGNALFGASAAPADSGSKGGSSGGGFLDSFKDVGKEALGDFAKGALAGIL